MSKKSFMPRTDEKRREWLNANVDGLQNGANGIAGKYNIAGNTINQLDSGRQWVNWALDSLAESRQSTAGFTEFKKNLFDGDVTVPVTQPVPPTFAKLPGVPLVGGVFTLASSVAVQIKKAVNYDVADGEVLGIEGAEQTMPDPTTTAPAIIVRMASGGGVEVVWPKGVFDGVRIEVDRGDGWKFLAVDTEPNYIDTFKPAVGQSVIYKYRAIYLLHDAEFGQWSNTAELAVKG